MECINCGKELIQLPGKRKKEFCNSTCRSNFWQKKKRKEVFDAPKAGFKKINVEPSKEAIKVESAADTIQKMIDDIESKQKLK